MRITVEWDGGDKAYVETIDLNSSEMRDYVKSMMDENPSIEEVLNEFRSLAPFCPEYSILESLKDHYVYGWWEAILQEDNTSFLNYIPKDEITIRVD